ncbi:GreA/GreB family elongation factor [Pelagibius sp. CAU 1746]|uniref:GreA/GreB family elongation factor n=1 Tax=Pelagibius sp. CAU 1746 TaxID=3140370 RepID=UPI00325A9F16
MAQDIRTLITPEGLARFQAELKQLQAERHEVCAIVSWAAGNGDRSENGDYIYNKQRLRQIDKRCGWLARRLKNATLVRPEDQTVGGPGGKVRFGSRVTYIDEDDRSYVVRIVGYDEADMARGEISIGSPVARALMGKSAGDGIEVQTPQGVKYFDIEAVE